MPLSRLPARQAHGLHQALQRTLMRAAAQVLPYFYIPYDEDLPLDQDGARAWLRDLARGIDLAMQIGASVRTTSS